MLLISSVFISEFPDEFLFFEISTHKQINREDYIYDDRRDVQLAGPDKQNYGEIPGMTGYAQYARSVEFIFIGYEFARVSISYLLNSNQLTRIIVTSAQEEQQKSDAE